MLDLPAVNPVDVAVLMLVGLAIWTGYQAGFIATTYSLATWVLAAAAAIVFTGPATALIAAVAGVPKPLASSIAFVLVVLIVEALFSFTGHLAIRPIVALVRRSPVSVVDRILGIAPSVVRSLFIAAVAVTALVSLPLASDLKATVETSRFGRAVSAQIAAFQPQLRALSGQLGGVPLLVTKIGEDETEKLDLPDGLQLAADPVAERQLFDLVNEERAQRGLAALVWDVRLVPVARAHSEEMFRLKYFSHQSPTEIGRAHV